MVMRVMRVTRVTRRFAQALVGMAGLVWGCISAKVPGDVNLGVYALTAVPATSDEGGSDGLPCLLDGDTGFGFEVTLSRSSDGTGAWMTMSGGISRDASWDGRVFSSTASAKRVFTGCSTCTGQVIETIELALLSGSQASSVGFVCPPGALDGGVPGVDPDAGITGPGPTGNDFDAVLACGVLTATLEVGDAGVADAGVLDAGVLDAGEVDAGGCPAVCRRCTVRFDVTGSRR